VHDPFGRQSSGARHCVIIPLADNLLADRRPCRASRNAKRVRESARSANRRGHRLRTTQQVGRVSAVNPAHRAHVMAIEMAAEHEARRNTTFESISGASSTQHEPSSSARVRSPPAPKDK
jgi:hypothetical protein